MREILAHKYNHAQLKTQENAWKNEMKSLQDKYTRNKTRKMTVLETHKGSSISTNEYLTSHNNSETVWTSKFMSDVFMVYFCVR
jgi:hypothetical protein